MKGKVSKKEISVDKIGEEEVNVNNGFKLLWKGIIGLFMLVILFGKWFLHFAIWFGKVFMKFGKAYEDNMDKRMKKVDKEDKKYAKQFKQY